MIGRRSLRRTLVVAISVLAVAVAGAALAWACTPKAKISAWGPAGPGNPYAPPGGTATVQGWEFPDQGTVTIRWSGAGASAVIGTATGPSFTTAVRIPAGASGRGAIVAEAEDGETTYYAPAAFIAGDPPAAAPDGETGGGSASPAPAPDGSGAGAPAAARPGGTSGTAPGASSGTTSGADRERGASRNSVSGAERAPARGDGEGRRTSGGSTAGGAADTGVTRLPSGETVFADSVGANGKAAAVAKRGSRTAPSERSADGDLWSGFGSDTAGSASLGEASGPVNGPGGGLTLSLALAGFGLVALMMGLAAAELRRRRAPARVSSD